MPLIEKFLSQRSKETTGAEEEGPLNSRATKYMTNISSKHLQFSGACSPSLFNVGV